MERRVVTRIEPTRRAHGLTPINIPELRRVAGYARVSTDNEEQENSYEAQVRYFTNYIHNHEGWTFAGMYTEEEPSYPALFCAYIYVHHHEDDDAFLALYFIRALNSEITMERRMVNPFIMRQTHRTGRRNLWR